MSRQSGLGHTMVTLWPSASSCPLHVRGRGIVSRDTLLHYYSQEGSLLGAALALRKLSFHSKRRLANRPAQRSNTLAGTFDESWVAATVCSVAYDTTSDEVNDVSNSAPQADSEERFTSLVEKSRATEKHTQPLLVSYRVQRGRRG